MLAKSRGNKKLAVEEAYYEYQLRPRDATEAEILAGFYVP